MKTSRTKTSPSRGVHVGWILGGAAVLGVAVGAGLSAREAQEDDVELRRATELGSKRVPMGAPMPMRVGATPQEDPLAPDPRSLRGIPAYPNSRPQMVASHPAVEGSALAVSWFTTPDSLTQVLRFYDTAFEKLGVVHVTHAFNQRMGYAAWLEAPAPDAGFGEGTLHMVSVAQQPRESLVFLSSSNPLELMQAQAPQLPPGMSLPPIARRPHVVDLSEEGMTRLNVFSEVPGTPREELEQFYVRAFQQGGWDVPERNVGPDRTSLTATRGGVTQNVLISQSNGGSQLLLTYDERLQRRAPGSTP